MQPGDDLAALIAEAAPDLRDGDVLVIAQKVVSKAEGRLRPLGEVEPDEQAREIGREHGKDARVVQVVLDETRELLRADHGVLICETRHGFVCANAGVDLSNSPGEDTAILLPVDPDASARGLRDRLGRVTRVIREARAAPEQRAPSAAPVRLGIVIADSFGRAWRLGVADVAIGAAGVVVLDDLRGQTDGHGRELRVTEIAIADELAAAADLARSKSSQEPVVLIRGADRFVTREDGPGAAALRRPRDMDLFR